MSRSTIASLFRKAPLWIISGVFLCLFNTASAQNRTITGTVTDAASRQPVENASILIKGESKGVSSDDKGRFSIQAPAGAVLQISMVGYTTREITITATQTVYNVALEISDAELESVVVTALGIKREEKALGYAVSTVRGEELTDAMSNNWSDALTGKVAGINLIKSGGGPAGSSKVVLRGENSLNGNSDALIVVDGVIISGASGRQTGSGSGAYLDGDSPVDFGTSMNDINPEDIESVSVLKGPGAAALYGARGANGAIIITTKGGSAKNKGLGISFNSNANFETISRWPDYQYEYGQGASGQHTWYSYGDTEFGQTTRSTSSAWGPKFDGQYFYQYDPELRGAGLTPTEWKPYRNNRKDFFETGQTYTNSLSLEGSNKTTSARLSLTNLHNKWIMPNTGYDRNTVAFSVNHKASEKLRFSAKVNYTNKKSDNLPSTGYNNQSIMYFIRGLTPNMNMDWFKDYWVPGREQIEQTRPFSSLLDNPYLISYEMDNKMNRHGVIGNVSATWNFTKDLSLLVRTAVDLSMEDRSQQRPFGTQKFVYGMYREQTINRFEINSDWLLSYKKNISDRISSSYSVGGAAMSNRYKKTDVRAEQLIYPGEFTLANSRNMLISLPLTEQYNVNSFYALTQFSYDEWLFWDLTGRVDWTSTLAHPRVKNNVAFFYPSINASAVLSQVLTLPKQINYLKLRGSVAGVGSGGVTPYRTSYNYIATSFPGGLSNPREIPNESLKPLFTTSYEVGIDARMFNNRIGLDVAVYQNNTRDEIFAIPIDRSSGYSALIANAGLVRNRGIEISLNAQVLRSITGLNWNTTLIYYSNQNRIVELVEGVDTYVMSTGPASRGSVEARPGGRMGDMYGIGYQRNEEGKIIYDNNGMPLRTDTVKYLGNTTPRWKASIQNEFRYKNFRFSFLVDGQFGGVSYSLTHAVLAEEGKLKKTLPGRYNGIIGDGVRLVDGKYEKNDVLVTNIQAYYDAHYNRDNIEANTFSTDFIKFREARIDYTIPSRSLQKIGLQRATIGIYGRDLFMITHWPAFDPEFGTLGDGSITAGFEIGQMPATRNVGVVLSIGL